MTEQFDSWESYFYPETIDEQNQGTLRNRLGMRDRDELRSAEYGLTAWRSKQLHLGQVRVPQTYDGDHVRALHRHLFQDVYDWAGQNRTVDLAKGRRGLFASLDGPRSIDSALGNMAAAVRGTAWPTADRDKFVQGIAETFAWVNTAHPFREGNGRVTKAFLHQVAEQSPRLALDFEKVPPITWAIFSDMSRPDPGEWTTHPDNMVPAFQKIAVPRLALDSPERESSDARSALYAASYPHTPARGPGLNPEQYPRPRYGGGPGRVSGPEVGR